MSSDAARIVPHFAKRAAKIESQSKKLCEIAKRHGTPCYVYDGAEVSENIARFKSAFAATGVEASIFYAVKSNPYLGLLKTVVQNGAGLDVSSTHELNLALEAGAARIVYTGPGKTNAELEHALQRCPQVALHVESFAELDRIQALATRHHISARCAVRVFTSEHTSWSKFGIPLAELAAFFDRAKACAAVNLFGIHFHISHNEGPERYVGALKELGAYLRNHVSPELIAKLTYIDIGGGMWPEAFEALYSWNTGQTVRYAYPDGLLEKLLNDELQPRIVLDPIMSIEDMALEIAGAFKAHIQSLNPKIKLYSEPGRFISHSSLHMLLQVVDVYPDRRCLIVDGGTNMLGWEKQQWVDYTPMFNLSSFSSTREIPWLIYGSLCTANDLFGYYLFSNEIKPGDILILPFQGAYTYTLAQSFIKGVPGVVELP